jgi:hypothetical protein
MQKNASVTFSCAIRGHCLAVIKLPYQLQNFCLVNMLIGRISFMEKGWETLVWLLFETIGL